MSKPRQTQHFAEIEYCLQNYFNSQLAPVMKEAQTYLTQKQVEEIGAYHASTAGVLRSLANGANGMPDDSLPYLRQTGEWNSKTTEDYVAMCRERIAATPETVEDLSLLAGEWRNAVVAEIGREQYEELSKELGGDLAFAYVDYRVEQMMIDRMAVEQMPKSSVEYILRKGAEGSLLGLAQGMMKSPLQQEIERRGEAAYRPSGAEKAWGTAVGVGMDTVMMGGISSWGSLIKLGGVEAVSYAVGKFMDGTEDAPAMTVEDCISRGVFGSEHNVFADFRAQGKVIKSYENPYILSLNERLAQKMGILTEKPLWAELMEAEAQVPHGWPFPAYEPPSNERKPGHGDVPMVVAPGREEEYLAMMQEEEEKERVETAKRETEKTATEQDNMADKHPTESGETQGKRNENGWGDLFGTFGLGTVPGAFATIIFAMPPVVRLTSLGIKQVPKNVVEASRSFGATPMQLLFKVQLPLALPTIMTGINQTILMSLSMVVIAAMIAAGGLGEIVLKGITQMKIGLGFEGGIAVVILAIILDRITQGLGKQKKGK